MNYSRQGSALKYGTSRKFLAGCVLVSVGILLAAGGGSWDITNHLLNKPETFFAPPHALLYTGVGSAVAGAAIMFTASRSFGTMPWQIKLTVAGVALLVSAGPVDFVWHSSYGLDGLLSPPHFVLVSGMVASSIGALASMVHHESIYRAKASKARLPAVLIIIGILPIWLALSGIVDMFSLPFSDTDYFNFNPNPALGVAVATLGFPFLIAAMLHTSSALAGRRFGVMSVAGAAFIVTGMFSSIIPNSALLPTIPFYLASIVPIVAADAILSYRYWRPFKIPVYFAGAIVGLVFFMIYYPLITYTYVEFMGQKSFWPSTIPIEYMGVIGIVFPLAATPAAAMGVLGAVASDRIIARNKIL